MTNRVSCRVFTLYTTPLAANGRKVLAITVAVSWPIPAFMTLARLLDNHLRA
jgi:hypothetical protein